MKQLKILDMQLLKNLAAETSPDAVPRLMSLYADELTETLDNMKKYYSTDNEAFKKTLHKAKNSSAIFGACMFHQYILGAEAKAESNKPIDDFEFKILHDIGTETLTMIKIIMPKDYNYA